MFCSYCVSAYTLHHLPINARLKLIFEGAFLTEFYDETAPNLMHFYLTLDSNGISRNISQLYSFAIANETELDIVEEIEREMTIHLDHADFESLHHDGDHAVMKVNLMTEMATSFPMNFIYDHSPLDESLGIILAAIVLIGLYVLIVLELVHRTLAAVLGSTTAIGRSQNIV